MQESVHRVAVHRVAEEGFNLNSSWIVFPSLEAIRAAMSSSRGMVGCRRGATLAFANTKRTSGSSDVGHKRSATATKAHPLASAKKCN